jgi:hypothetical protein
MAAPRLVMPGGHRDAPTRLRGPELRETVDNLRILPRRRSKRYDVVLTRPRWMADSRGCALVGRIAIRRHFPWRR